MITVNQRVENSSAKSVTLYPYGLIRRAGEPETIDFFVLHEGPLGVFDRTLSEQSYSDLTDAGKKGINVKPNESGGWIGLTDKYWMTTLIPPAGQKFRMASKYTPQTDTYQTDMRLPAIDIRSGSENVIITNFFAGAKEVNTIKDYQKNLALV